MVSTKTGKTVYMNDILTLITLLLSFTNIAHAQLNYNDAVCNGPTIGALLASDDVMTNITFDTTDIDGTTNFTDITFTTQPDIGGSPQFLASAIHPHTEQIYAIIRSGDITDDNYYIGELVNDNSLGWIVNNTIQMSTNVTVFYSAMTYDCDGLLYAIDFEDRNIYTINPITGKATLFQTGGSTMCNPGIECSETMSYNWDDGQLYRIDSSDSSSKPVANLYIESLTTNTETRYYINDTNNSCANRVEGIEYIGNDLFLISCDNDAEGNGPNIRLLDISDIETAGPQIRFIDSNSIQLPQFSAVAAGLIPSTSTGLCTAVCPTDSPTQPPSLAPSIAPSLAPSIAPTQPPSDAPSLAPSLAPSIAPSISPSIAPTSPPTNAPSLAPSIAPSLAPTVSPTEEICPPCPYNISLSEISPVSLSSDCPTVSPTPRPTARTIWNKRGSESESSVKIPRTYKTVNTYYSNSGGNNVLHKQNNNAIDSRDSGSGSGSGSSDRRLLSDSDSDSNSNSDSSDDTINRCFPDGSPLIFVDNLCDNGKSGKSGYYDDSSSDSSDSNEIDLRSDQFLSQTICVTYNINNFAPNGSDCGDINNIFLGICENENTDFDSLLLGIADIDRIISNETFEDGNNILSAKGARNSNNELGVLIELNNMNDEMFTICFENVSVTTAFNQTKDSLDVGNGYINFTNNAGTDTLCPSQGLPCLNFFFGCEDDLIGPEEEVGLGRSAVGLLSGTRNCYCRNGMTTLTLRYEGPVMADTIIAFFGNNRHRILCTFYNIMPGDIITCTSENMRLGIFGRNTKFSVSYSENNIRRRKLLQKKKKSSEDDINGDCVGKIRTTCGNQIIGDRLRGCNDLIVLSHIDGNGALCDAQILALETNNNANALINNAENINGNPLKVLNELDPYIKWTLICIFIAFMLLIFASIYVCFSYKCKNITEEDEIDNINDEEIDVIASAIALSKQNEQLNGDLENDFENNENNNDDSEIHQLNKIWDVDDNENTQHTFEVTA